MEVAVTRGFVESSHVGWIGKAGLKDWELKKVIIDDDWTFVTNNSADFRGPSDDPGSKGQYADVFLHAGLICLNSDVRMNQAIQVDLFASALDHLGAEGEVTNEVLEVDLDRDGHKLYRRYSLPKTAE